MNEILDAWTAPCEPASRPWHALQRRLADDCAGESLPAALLKAATPAKSLVGAGGGTSVPVTWLSRARAPLPASPVVRASRRCAPCR